MGRLIEGDALLAEVVKTQAIEPDKAVAKIIMLITEAEKVDAVEVVRCKDCKHCEHGCKCRLPLGASLYDNDYILVEEDDFCSYGERKDND